MNTYLKLHNPRRNTSQIQEGNGHQAVQCCQPFFSLLIRHHAISIALPQYFLRLLTRFADATGHCRRHATPLLINGNARHFFDYFRHFYLVTLRQYAFSIRFLRFASYAIFDVIRFDKSFKVYGRIQQCATSTTEGQQGTMSYGQQYASMQGTNNNILNINGNSLYGH